MERLVALYHRPLKGAVDFYGRYKKFAPAVFFFGGFLWDSLTLTRVDRMSDNLILLGYLMLLGIFIILSNFVQKGIIQNRLILKYCEWYPMVMQFLFGSLFSAYVVFYFHSASFTKTSLFLLLLTVLLVLNEFIEKKLTNLYLQMSLYFLVSFSFFIFFVPVVTKTMSYLTFLIGGILSLLLIGGMLFLFFKRTILETTQQVMRLSTLILSGFVLMNALYLSNLIPPVPLSLKSIGIYREVSREGNSFKLTFEKPAWYQFWKHSNTPFRYNEGDAVYCFTAIFAPAQLHKRIYHHWQRYSPERREWITLSRSGYGITGGREAGYRSYTYKKQVSPGKWRVEVRTEDGLLLGFTTFEIVKAERKVEEVKSILY